MTFEELMALGNLCVYKCFKNVDISDYPYWYSCRDIPELGGWYESLYKTRAVGDDYYKRLRGASMAHNRQLYFDCGGCSSLIMSYLLHYSQKNRLIGQFHAGHVFVACDEDGPWSVNGIHQFIVMTLDHRGIGEDFYQNPENFERSNTILVDPLHSDVSRYCKGSFSKGSLPDGGKYYFLGEEWKRMQVYDARCNARCFGYINPKFTTWKCSYTLETLFKLHLP